MATTPAPVALQGLTWQRLKRFGVWSVWHIADAHNVSLCGHPMTGQKQRVTYDPANPPAYAKATDFCIACAKVKTDAVRQAVRKPSAT